MTGDVQAQAAQSVDRHFSVNGMAALALPLAQELELYRRLGVQSFGLPAAKLIHTQQAVVDRLMRSVQAELAYLFVPFSARPEDADGWGRQVALLSGAVTAADRYGASTVYFTTGPSGVLTWDQAADRLADAIAPVLKLARDSGIWLAVENSMSIRSDISFVHSVRDAAMLAQELDLGLCVDLYCAWQERDLAGTLESVLDRIRLVQVADFRVGTLSVPNRWVPGDGDLPLPRLLKQVWSLGYRGLVDLELAGPAIDAEGAQSALRRGMAWLAAVAA